MAADAFGFGAKPECAARIAEELGAMAHREQAERQTEHLHFAAAELEFRIDAGNMEGLSSWGRSFLQFARVCARRRHQSANR